MSAYPPAEPKQPHPSKFVAVAALATLSLSCAFSSPWRKLCTRPRWGRVWWVEPQSSRRAGRTIMASCANRIQPCRAGRRLLRGSGQADCRGFGTRLSGCGRRARAGWSPRRACGARSFAPRCGHGRLRPGSRSCRSWSRMATARWRIARCNCSGRRFRPRGISLSCRKVLTIKEIGKCEEVLLPPASWLSAALF